MSLEGTPPVFGSDARKIGAALTSLWENECDGVYYLDPAVFGRNTTRDTYMFI